MGQIRLKIEFDRSLKLSFGGEPPIPAWLYCVLFASVALTAASVIFGQELYFDVFTVHAGIILAIGIRIVGLWLVYSTIEKEFRFILTTERRWWKIDFI